MKRKKKKTTDNGCRPVREVQDFDPSRDGRTTQGAYLTMPLIWIDITGKRDDFLLLGYLWNEWHKYKCVGKLAPRGYFYCTVKSVTKALKMNEHTQARCLKRLEACGLIKRKFDAPPNDYYGKGRDLRYVKVQRRAITNAAQTVESMDKKALRQSLKIKFDQVVKDKRNRKPHKYCA